MFPRKVQSSARRLFVRRRMMSGIPSKLIHIEQTVKEALANGEPVVALESTIIAHGMPYPQNIDLAQELELILKAKGVTPATIAVKDGVCRIGLSAEELADLAISGQENRAKKCSTRDLPTFLAKYKGQDVWGATTVASTMKLAHLAGINTFVTGGSGGVHRQGHNSMDVSADLTELARTPVVVVSAGVKSILDIERTLEVLETNGVPVYGWQTDEFPAFFSPASGVSCPYRAEDEMEIARAYHLSRALDMKNGFLVGVPNQDAAGSNVEATIQSALEEAEKQGIRGQDTTPFILKYVANKTGGDSLRSNIALVKNNAKVGARIAHAIASTGPVPKGYNKASFSSIPSSSSSIKSKYTSKNVAILRKSSELRMSPLSPSQPVRDEVLNHACMLVIDGGRDVKGHLEHTKMALQKNVDILFIPSGTQCSVNASKEPQFLPCLKYMITSVEDLLVVSDGWTDSMEDVEFALNQDNLDTVKKAVARVLERMHEDEAHILVMLGHKGLLMGSRKNDIASYNELPPKEGVEIQNCTAASDCLAGVFLHELLNEQDPLSAAVVGYNVVEGLWTSGGISSQPFLSQYEAKQ